MVPLQVSVRLMPFEYLNYDRIVRLGYSGQTYTEDVGLPITMSFQTAFIEFNRVSIV
jgi:hypothetical protein